jgi:hypothetical protein
MARRFAKRSTRARRRPNTLPGRQAVAGARAAGTNSGPAPIDIRRYVDPCEKATPTAADETLLRSLPVPSKANLPAAGPRRSSRSALHGVSVGVGGVVLVVLIGVRAFVVIRRRAPVAQ